MDVSLILSLGRGQWKEGDDDEAVGFDICMQHVGGELSEVYICKGDGTVSGYNHGNYRLLAKPSLMNGAQNSLSFCKRL